MGLIFSRAVRVTLNGLSGSKECKLLMLGLDAAGKTTCLYRFQLDETLTTIPTIGFNVEQLIYKNITFSTWDIGGQDKIRPLWRHYYQGTQGLVYVLDSNDRDRIEEAHDELHRILADFQEPALHDVPLCVIANKQDQPNAMSVAEVTDKLGLFSLRHRQWHVQGATATSGKGLIESFDWLGAAADL